MKIADFFVKIGMEGAGDVSKGLGKVSGSLKELFSMSIQTKLTLAGIAAGLIGAAFSAGKTGAALNAFSKGFGLSAQELQRWQMASEAFNVSGEEMAGTIKGLQDALAEAKLGRGFNEVFTNLMIDPSKIKNGFELANVLRQRVQSGGVDATRILSSGLLGENVFQAFRQMGDPLKTAPVRKILSDKEIQEMQKISVAFTRFKENISRKMEEFIVNNGPLIIRVMTKLEKFLEAALKFVDTTTSEALNTKEGSDNAPRMAVKMAKGAGSSIFDFFKGQAEQTDKIKQGLYDKYTEKQAEPNIKPVSPLEGKYAPEQIEFQKGGTSIIIDTVNLPSANLTEFGNDVKMLATHKAVSKGVK